jgi:hypothetical protein
VRANKTLPDAISEYKAARWEVQFTGLKRKRRETSLRPAFWPLLLGTSFLEGRDGHYSVAGLAVQAKHKPYKFNCHISADRLSFELMNIISILSKGIFKPDTKNSVLRSQSRRKARSW